MRQFQEKQLPLTPIPGTHQHTQELNEISSILDQQSELAQLVRRDLGGRASLRKGRDGLTGEQVLRIALLKQIHGLSYRELEFHLGDSASFRAFARLPFGRTRTFKTLQANVKRIRPQTWEAIHRDLVRSAHRQGIEKGHKIRGDCTVVDANIHAPTDSSLLWDCVRVVTRSMKRIAELVPELRGSFRDQTRRAKRRAYEIAFSSRKKDRRRLYRDLLGVSRVTREQATELADRVAGLPHASIELDAYEAQLRRYLGLMDRVLRQTERRVIEGEMVPSSEKIVSIFEDHTDIIVKDRRDVLYGHKVLLSGGSSSLILDCVIEEGNPADSTLVGRTLERHIELFGRAPRQACFDGGFAAKANIDRARELGVQDIAFHKKRGFEITEMVKSAWVYRRLRNFRAGIEGCISTLKRAFQMDRCNWRGLSSFRSYVWASVVSFNLVVMARHRLTAERA